MTAPMTEEAIARVEVLLDLADIEPKDDYASLRTDDLRALLSLARQGLEMREALEKIERWFGEFPDTGLFWPNDDGTESDRPMSYGATWGANGERDFMRHIARAALQPRSR